MEHQTLSLLLPPSDDCAWAPPLDTNDLTVRLEAEGVTESTVRARYGFNSVWEMSEAHLSEARAQRGPSASEPKGSRAVVDYLKGMAFAAPLIVCFLVVLFGKVSLWGGSLSGNQAAAIALATVSSFVVTGGFIQVVSRQGLFYKETRQWSLCSKFCASFVRIGFVALVVGVTLGFFANLYFRWLPPTLFGWCAAFNLSIGTYLLTAGVLYVINGELPLTVATLAGTAVVMVFRLALNEPLLFSQISGVSTAAFCNALFAFFRFRRAPAGRPTPAPSRSQMVYMLWPYFTYGCLYYLFLFVDRLIAWSAHAESSTLPLQFRGAYETSLDVCLFAFIIQVGWIRAGLVRFYRLVVSEQKACLLQSRSGLREVLLRFYVRQICVFAGLFVFSAIPVAFAIAKVPNLRAMLLLRVVLLMMAGIPLLTIGLWNTALLFALSRPLYVLATLCGAVACNVCVGYLLSRIFTYDLAIVGFDIGACALAITSGWFCARLLKNFDYHYFAANI